MARGKRALALFEVVQAGRRSGQKATSTLRTPRWWFRFRKSDTPAPAVTSGTAPQPKTTEAHPTAPAPRKHGIDLKLFKFLPERQQVQVHVSYTSAIVSAFAVVVVVVLSYLIGRHVTRSPEQALAGPSTEQLRQGPARPQVLDVTPNQSRQAASPQDADEARTAAPLMPTPTASSPEAGGQRIIGRNYVVVQIYPDEKSAIEARDLLARNGIAATIEKGLPGYAATSWHCVVGLQGFDRIRNNPEYDRYEKQIRDISGKFAGSSKFKKFDPQAYRWKG